MCQTFCLNKKGNTYKLLTHGDTWMFLNEENRDP
jgi:hypothetical protein